MTENRKQIKKGQRQKGYTLIELVMGIVLMGIIAGIFIATIVEGSRTYAFIESQKEAAFTAKFALKRLLIECRNAYQISAADTTDLTFINTYSENIQINLSAPVLNISNDGGVNFYPLCQIYL